MEDEMPVLKSLTFTTMPTPGGNRPPRNRLLGRGCVRRTAYCRADRKRTDHIVRR